MQKRKKKATPRSSTGCSTCRTRRLKCGEERPHCKRCIRAGLQCGGYEHVDSDSSHGFHTFALRPNESPTVSVPGQAPSRIRKASRALISIRQVGNRPVCQNCWKHVYSDTCLSCGIYTHSPTPSPTAVIPFSSPILNAEKDIFQHFIIATVPDCCAYASSSFWNDIVLPRVHEENVARSCALALGAVHREVSIRARNPQAYVQDYQYMLQYNKALNLVQNYLAKEKDPCMETVMTCCSLFYSIEIARGDYSTAHRHAKAGLVILQEWHKRAARKQLGSNLNFRQLDQVQRLMEAFAGLDVSLSFSSNFSQPLFTMTTPEERSGKIPCLPTAYSGVDEAWIKCNKLLNWGCHLLGSLKRESKLPHELPPDMFREMELLRDEMVHCKPSFFSIIEIENSRVGVSSGNSVRAYILNISFLAFELVYRMFISGFLPNMSFEGICRQSENIIAMVAALTVGFESKMTTRLEMRPFLFLETAVGSLSLVRMVCKHEGIRQRALELLDIWSVRGVALIGEGADTAIEAARESTRPEQFEGSPTNQVTTHSSTEEAEMAFQEETISTPSQYLKIL